MLEEERLQPGPVCFQTLITSLGRVGYTHKAFKLYVQVGYTHTAVKLYVRVGLHTHSLQTVCAG